MTQKQREDHVQAKYWNGFITRVEAQKVFDEMSQVIQGQAAAMAKFDMAISCIAEKVGVTPADVNEWVKAKMKTAEAEKAAQEVKAADNANGAAKEQEVPSPIILTN